MAGEVSGDIAIDLTDALGSLTNQSTGDFIMIEAPALPEAHGA